MFRNGLQPSHVIVVLIILVLLFGAKRLPDMAKSVGQSLKIFKSEIKDLKSDDAAAVPAAPPVAQAPPVLPAPVEQPSAAPAAPITPPNPAAPPATSGSDQTPPTGAAPQA